MAILQEFVIAKSYQKIFVKDLEGSTGLFKVSQFICQRFAFTGWISNGKFEIRLDNGKQKYMTMREILKRA